jgi:ADP-ribose pyrophosphatase YjhB (NUDIX family)
VQIYSVYYHESGRFLIGFKLKKGYFFYDPRTGGDLVPEGQALNGGGKHALPGGKQEAGETVIEAARREFHEETAADLQAIQTVAHELKVKDKKGKEHTFGAGFFRIETDIFTRTTLTIALTNLPQGEAAKAEVEGRQITKYSQIHERYPNAPLDNELADARVWDVRNPIDWLLIEEWEDDKDLSWYYHILFYLKHTILK